ncbi:TPA: hypothetical protein ACLGO4_004587 [Salmonella enterica]
MKTNAGRSWPARRRLTTFLKIHQVTKKRRFLKTYKKIEHFKDYIMPYCFHTEIDSLRTLLEKNCEEGKAASPSVVSLLDQAKRLQLEAVSILNNAFTLYEKRTANEGQAEFEYTALQQLELLENFDSIQYEDQVSEQNQASRDEREAQRLSGLFPSGLTMTNTELHNAAKRIVERAKTYFGSHPAPLQAHVWSYRYEGCSMLSCDLNIEGDVTKIMPITVSASGELETSIIDEPQVYDMAEALHLVSMITTALNAKVIVGRRANEMNSDVLHKQL